MRTAPEYLLAIYIAQHRDDPPVAPGELGEMLDRSPAAVTEMCQRLAEDGLVSYEPYDGVTLTESGREEATELHETYVTVSWFFRGVLDLDDHETEAMDWPVWSVRWSPSGWRLRSPVTPGRRVHGGLPIQTRRPPMGTLREGAVLFKTYFRPCEKLIELI